MKSLLRLFLVAGLLVTAACQKPSILIHPPPPKPEVVGSTIHIEPEAATTPIIVVSPHLVSDPSPMILTPAGRALIYDFEVGGRNGYNPHPEAPDARISGITEGIGYDNHTNSAAIILQDWAKWLGPKNAKRLADTHPYYGSSAQSHLHEVKDILVSWQAASDIFDRVDVAREFASARRLWKGFDLLRPNAQAALISQGFNRGWSTAGANRREMAVMKELVPKRDYDGIAAQMRASIRVWKGTSIYSGMARRRYAEAKLLETP